MVTFLVDVLLSTLIIGTIVTFIFMVVNAIKWTINSDF